MADVASIATDLGVAVGAVLATLAVVLPQMSAAKKDARDAADLALKLSERVDDLEERGREDRSALASERTQRHALQQQFTGYIQETGSLWQENARLMGVLEERTRRGGT